MKKFTYIITFLISFVSFSQSYVVIHTIGKIQDASNGQYLSKGMKLSENAELLFETPGARAALLSATKGRFVIQEKGSTSEKSDVVYTLASVISPVRGRLSTRAGGINNKLDFEGFFGEGPVAFLSDQFYLQVSPSAFPMNDKRFFYAQYRYGSDLINKRLDYKGDTLIINKTSFFSIDGKPIEENEVSDIKLYYYNTEVPESNFMTALTFTVVSKEDLKSMVDSLDGDMESVLEMVNALYGKCTSEYLNLIVENLD